MILDTFGRNYLTLALEIDKHIDGYIDAYLGPADLKEAVAATEKKSPAALLDAHAWLLDNRPDSDPARTPFLDAELRAIGTTLRQLNGAEIDYLDEVAAIYDITPQRKPEALFEDAHRALEEALPGSGTVEQRQMAFRQRFQLKKAQILPLVELAKAECRRRTVALVDLVEGEAIDVTLVENQPWGAYNWYRGNGQSLVEFNTDVPKSALRLINTFAHEAYPGHHTEHQLKEKLLLHERGYAEFGVQLLHSPSAVIAEGIATTALEMIFPDDSHLVWLTDHVLPAADIAVDDSAELRQQLKQVSDASANLKYVSGNAAIQFHRGELTADQTKEYIQTYALASAKRAAKSFSFLSHPLFRSYLFTYTEGYDLLDQATDKKAAFLRLLSEPILPSQILPMFGRN